MRWRTGRLIALAAVVPVIAVVPASSSVAMLKSQGDSGNPQPGVVKLIGPGSALDCFPIGRVVPTKPGPVTPPRVTPQSPGPVPIPEVVIACPPGSAPPPFELIPTAPRPNRR